MPLDFEKFLQDLDKKRDYLRKTRDDARSVADRYLGALDDLDPSTPQDTAHLGDWCGATVEEEGAMYRDVTVESRSRFIRETLDGRVVAAVDGSQVKPDESFDIPVGVANCALVTNDYGDGEQDLARRQKTLVPDERRRGDPYSGEEVKTERDLLEIRVATRAVRDGADLVLFDNGLIPNFVNYESGDIRDRYITAFVGLLQASEEERVPVAGFLDGSRAGDLLNMLKEYTGEKRAPFMTDAKLLADVMSEGQRTKAFRVRRKDVFEEGEAKGDGGGGERKNLLEEYADAGYAGGVCTSYLDLGADLPARLEFPAWILHDDRLDDIVSMVVAEAMRGERYPHILLEAHDAAVVRRAGSDHVHRAVERHVNRRIDQKDRVKRRG